MRLLSLELDELDVLFVSKMTRTLEQNRPFIHSSQLTPPTFPDFRTSISDVSVCGLCLSIIPSVHSLVSADANFSSTCAAQPTWQQARYHSGCAVRVDRGLEDP
jgi:hypothetical protein